MTPTPLEVLLPEVYSTQFGEIFGAQASEFIEQLRQRLAPAFTLTLSQVSLAIKGLKRLALTELQDHLCPRHPIRLFAVNQMGQDIERAPGVFTFVSHRPHFRQITKKRVKSGRSASQQRNCLLQSF
jgi:hypothetical protein